MSDNVVFEEESGSQNSTRSTSVSSNKGIIVWLVSHKIAKNTKEAEYILLGVFIFFVIIALVVFIKGMPAKPVVKDFSKTDFIHTTQSP